MEVDRAALLSKLVAVSPGLTAADTVQQSSCYCFRKGWVYTYNEEIACAISSGLDPAFTGAVAAGPLGKYLKGCEGTTLSMSFDSKSLSLKGKGRRVTVPVQPEILLPVGRVERPEAWQPLHKDFGRAVGLVAKCTKKKVEDRRGFGKVCVHVCPDWVEACDGVRLARYRLETFVSRPALVRATTLKEAASLGFSEAAETPKWLHFRTRGGFRMSVRKWESDGYPDQDEYLALRGRRVKLPPGLKGAAPQAGVFAEAGEAGPSVTVSFDGKTVSVEGRSGLGEAVEELAGEELVGGPLSFRVSAQLLKELAEQAGSVEVAENLLRYEDGSYVYLTSLEGV